MLRTISPGTLTVQSAYPDPPFDLMRNGMATGFDVELMHKVCERLGFENCGPLASKATISTTFSKA